MNLMKREDKQERVESRRGNVYRTPACDIMESGESYIVFFDVPGVEKKDINIKVEKNLLSLTAECGKNPGQGYECLRDEMIYSGFRRSFDLGEMVDPEKIKAEYREGTLKVVLPKREEQRSKQITVRVD